MIIIERIARGILKVAAYVVTLWFLLLLFTLSLDAASLGVIR